MSLFALIIIFVLGTMVGSFLNVVVLRHHTGLSYLGGRSQCLSCSRILEVYELIPIVSYVCIYGRCSSCRTPLSVQYPLVELITGLLFAYTAYHVGISGDTIPFLLILWALISVSIIMFVYDMKHQIIPNEFVYPFIFMAGALLFVSPFGIMLPSVWHFSAGPLFFLVFYALWLLSSGKWIGFGDVKLVIGIGWLLGIGLGISALALSVWIGAIVSILLILLSRMDTTLFGRALSVKETVPFAPFLLLGTAIVYFTKIDVVGISRLFGI